MGRKRWKGEEVLFYNEEREKSAKKSKEWELFIDRLLPFLKPEELAIKKPSIIIDF